MTPVVETRPFSLRIIRVDDAGLGSITTFAKDEGVLVHWNPVNSLESILASSENALLAS